MFLDHHTGNDGGDATPERLLARTNTTAVRRSDGVGVQPGDCLEVLNALARTPTSTQNVWLDCKLLILGLPV